jgi:hypothetical protein
MALLHASNTNGILMRHHAVLQATSEASEACQPLLKLRVRAALELAPAAAAPAAPAAPVPPPAASQPGRKGNRMAKMAAAPAPAAAPAAAAAVSTWAGTLLTEAVRCPELAGCADLAALQEISIIQEDLRGRKVQPGTAEAAVQQVLAELHSRARGLGLPLLQCRALLLAAMHSSDDASRLAQQALAAAEALQEQRQPGGSSKANRKCSNSGSSKADVLHVQALAHALQATAMANEAAQQGLMARHSKQQQQQEEEEEGSADEVAGQVSPASTSDEVEQLWQEQRQHIQVCLQAWQQAQDAAAGCGPASPEGHDCIWRYPTAEVQLLVQLWHAAGLQGRALRIATQ